MTDKELLRRRITEYLSGGGLFNPELANHDAVRDLLIDCRAALTEPAASETSCPKISFSTGDASVQLNAHVSRADRYITSLKDLATP